jgi:signal transduction histidine kinase
MAGRLDRGGQARGTDEAAVAPLTATPPEPERVKATRTVLAVAVALLTAIAAATGYSVLAITGRVPMSQSLFFAWLELLQALNVWWLVLFWKRRRCFSVQARIFMLLWGSATIWYWLFGTLYYVLHMNFDRFQLKWIAFVFLWEVPVFTALVSGTAVRAFRPIQRFLESGESPDPSRLYQTARRYPGLVGILVSMGSVVGYLLGAWQMRVLAHLPAIEQLKNMLNGVALAIFLGLALYLTVDLLVAQIRSRLETAYRLPGIDVRRSLAQKILAVTLASTLGSMVLLSLFILQSYQLTAKEYLVQRLQRDLEEISARLDRSGGSLAAPEVDVLLRAMRAGARGQVMLLRPGEGLPPDEFGLETRQALIGRPSGVVEDRRKDLKIVAFAQVPSQHATVASIAYLTDFYGPLGVSARFLIVAGLFVLIPTTGMIVFMSLILTRIIHSLMRESEELRRLAEDHAKELARSNEELAQFAYVASHDLQEPLRMVAGYVQLLACRYKGKLDSAADEFIAYAVGGAKRMQALISDLLQYSQVGTRGKPFEPTDTQTIVRQVLTMLQVAIAESGAVVASDGLPLVWADGSQLAQLFQNLIANAIKFRKKDEPPRIHIEAKRQDQEWVFSVCDNGIGLDMQFAERIFLIFQRLHNQAECPGTGIGLAVCKKVVERHGGRIWVESQPGRGATFSFTLPVNEGC